MNIIKYYVDISGNITSIVNPVVAQSSNDNQIYLYTEDPDLILVDLQMRQPTGKLLAKLHLIFSTDESGNAVWKLDRIPAPYIGFTMAQSIWQVCK